MSSHSGTKAEIGKENLYAENLYALFRSRFPDDLTQVFLETGQGSVYSYGDLERQTARYAAFLVGLGLAKGDRVLVQVEKSPQALFLCLACFRAGLIYLPLNPAYRKNEVQYVLSDAEPKAVVCGPETSVQSLLQSKTMMRELGIERVETLDGDGGGSLVEKSRQTEANFEMTPCQGNDLAAILYTSGTTGRSKGAMISHRNLAANDLALQEYWQWTATDVLLHALPVYHVHGLFIACHCALLSGARMVFLNKFDARTVIGYMPRSTIFMGVPTYYTRLLEEPGFGRDVCSNIRLFISGSAPLLEQTYAAFRERTGHEILERYGMTETGVNTSNPVNGPRIAGTVGQPLPGVTVRLVDGTGKPVPCGEVGELQVKGDHVVAGYWRKPDETAEAFTADGFLKTGDLGKLSQNGYFSVVGRAKDLVITGGLNVYPKEIESAIDQLEGIVESAVIGVPHPDFGEAVVALVVRATGREDMTESRVVAELKAGLANYKVPKRVFFLDELPRNAMGKVQKNALRAQPEYAPF